MFRPEQYQRRPRPDQWAIGAEMPRRLPPQDLGSTADARRLPLPRTQARETWTLRPARHVAETK
jgi:hypothetical protein